MKTLKVDAQSAGQRADVFVARKYPSFNRSALSRLFKDGFVTSDKKPVKAGQKLKIHQSVKVDDSLLKAKTADIELPIIYEDDNVVVINKPAGILTHSKGALNNEDTVANWLTQHLKKTNHNINTLFPGCHPENNRLGVAHRLDRATSGVMILAKNEKSLKHLQKQFSDRKVNKTYLAIVEGRPKQASAVVDVPIGRDPKRPQTFRADQTGKPAQTQYKTLKNISKNYKTYSVLELKPVTGRTHQIRIHLAYIGNPVVGDFIYGHVGGELLLHAWRLKLMIPDGRIKFFSAPPPNKFARFVTDDQPAR